MEIPLPIKLNPDIIFNIKKCMYEGYNLYDILDNYKKYTDNQEFKDEIIAAYYHINNGPDLREYQIKCHKHMKEWFSNPSNKNYKIHWPCGMGKTKMVLTHCKKINYKNICIAVPSVILMEQFSNELRYLYPMTKLYCFSSNDVTEGDVKIKPSIYSLIEYLNSNNRYKIVLTTYHSSEKIAEICCQINFTFDLIICDEAHHLHNKSTKKFKKILYVSCNKRIYVTATPYLGNDKGKMNSLETSSDFKGESSKLSLIQGIEMGYITDYQIVILQFDDDINIMKQHINIKPELVISCYMAVKAIYQGISKKILIYCNKIDNAKIIKKLINNVIEENNGRISNLNDKGIELNIFNDELNGTHKLTHRNEVLNRFRTSQYGIMSSVQLFGEGFDCPMLDSILFAENMSSSIRIIQSGLRACRKDPDNENKIAKILIPIFDYQDTKVKQVLIKMKEIDENIDNKLCISNYNSFKNEIISNSNRKNYSKLCNKFKKIMEKINLEYINDIFRSREIDNSKLLDIDKQLIKNIMLTSISIVSYNNFYNSILSQSYKECYWGLKYKENGKNEKIWSLLNTDDLIVFVESEYISFSIIKNKIKDINLSNKFYNSELFSLIFELKFVKRIKFNKKKFMKLIGYSESDNLMSAKIYRGIHKNKILNIL
tara:strand:- start:76 stop:2046 length:1971 start_codon:yes stop_codon:yes gene_type:complete